jgi:hypothetical protein
MRIIKAVLLAVCVAMFCAIFAIGVRADTWNKKTIVTFSDSVEIPGQVLPAGTYVFKLADSVSDRHIVQIWTEDQSQLIATILAVPDYRLDPPRKSAFEFDERPGDSPMALRSWFYPGDNIGQQFVYPDSEYPHPND